MRRVTRPPTWSKHLGLLVALSLVLGLVAVPPAGGARAASPPHPLEAGSATPPVTPSPVASPTPTLPPGATPTVTDVPSPTVTVSPTSSLTPTPTGTPQGPPTQTITPTPPPDPTPTPPDWAVILPGEGGVLASPDGWVRVDFPPGAVTAPAGAAFSLVETPPFAAPADPFYRFDLSAWDLATGEPVTTFRESLTLTLSYSETAVVGLNEASLRLVSWDPATAGWLPLPGQVDLVENRITAALGHFSLLGAQGDPAAVVAETFKAYQTDLFAGSAGYGFDLEAPSGPNGLAPSLSLRYNSGAVNQMKAPYSPGTWVGSGWSLDLGYVEYQEATGEYSLVLNGASHRIVYDDDTGAYHTQPESFVKVTRSAVGTRRWEVTAKDGTTYRFGQTLEEDTRYGGSYGPSVLFYQVGDAQNRCKRHLLKWYLDEVEDTHGNVLGIVHQAPQTERNLDCDHSCQGCDNGYYPVEVYPYRVLYSTNASAGDGVAEHQVEFTLEERYDEGVDDHVPDGTLNYETMRLAGVTVTVTTTNEIVVSYDLAYDGAHYPLPLTEVQQYGAGGSVSLPAVTFGYERMELSLRVQQETGGCQTEQAYGDRPFLTSVQNGYGGELAVGYAAWGPCEPDAGGAWFSEPFRESGWGRQTVVTYTLSAGVEGSPEVSYTYGYTNGVQAGGSFVGFEEGRTRDAAGNDSTLEHYAHGWDAGHILNGKVEEARHYQGSSTLLRETANTWETDSLWGEEADFVWLAQQVERACQGAGSCQSKKTAYGYDAALQGGTQYGNVTSVKEYDSADANTPVRTTRRWYNTRDDSSAYIVDRLQTEAVYAQEGWTEASASWYYYDTYDSHQQQVGIKGELWAVQKRLNKTEDSSFVYWDAAETRYGYDAYGNQVSATAYAGYAQMKIDKVSGAVSRNGGPTLPRTTTTTYDAAYHTFPVTVTRPAVGRYVPVEAREYYGVNEQNPNTGCGVYGQVKLVRDTSNGTDTWYEYDPFGRLTYRWLPGDTPLWNSAYASQAYGYDDAVRRLYSRQRDDLGGSPTYLEGWQFYDGLGRLVQGQSESAATGQVIVTNRSYDALDRPDKESLPYQAAGDGWTYLAPNWSQPHTTTAYDALGRTTQVTNPDGTYTEHHYDVVTEGGVTYTYDDVLDANRHRKQYRSDSLGRLRQVVEMAGDCGAWGYSCGGLYTTPWSVYATTRYEYGVTDNLVEVADAAGSVTEMVYDLLGRKTAMSDPDMGDWTYGYDALGSLTSQTDAKGQTITFTYDALDRLTLKDYPSGTDVHYYYDGEKCSACSTPAGKLFGQRTAMEDGSGWAVYSYDDLRGRLTQERRSITGSGTFVTGWGYDAIDRVVTMTYPGGNGGQAGEQVTATYNAQGLTYSVLGSSSYLLTTEYNALGQWTRRAYGNGKETRRIYRSDNFRLERIESGGAGDSNQQYLVYGYDLAGNVMRIEDWNAGAPAPQVQQFTYDPLDRLRTAGATGGSGGTYGPEEYTYDAVGNLTAKAGVGYAYSSPGMAGVRPHAVRRVTGSGGSAKSVTIRAKGTASGGVWPLMSLYVNGQYRTQWMVSSTSYADYSATTTLTGNDQIEVVYSNDAGSRDLYVDYAVVDGRTVQAEGGAAVIDKGSGDAAFDGLEVIAGQQALYVNGALRFVVGTQAYAACYDANGNMTWRLLVDAAYEQLWDAENRLVQVKKGTTVQATFVYDGDGARVKATVGSVTTAYVGSHFEWTGSTSTMKKYYYAGGERVAMRWGGSTVYWLLGDHLGSTAMTVASSGIKVSELRYKAWGETRHESGTTPTTHRFTGQRLESSLGLYHMGARWYDPTLARWLSADTIVPDPALPQGLNRYSYVSNRPVSHTDPSGHMPCGQACPGDYTTWQIGFGEAYHGTWNTANQAQARAVAELAVHVGDVLLAMASNQHDIASTAARGIEIRYSDRHAGSSEIVHGCVERLGLGAWAYPQCRADSRLCAGAGRAILSGGDVVLPHRWSRRLGFLLCIAGGRAIANDHYTRALDE